jgi:hypothetical protein
MAAVSTFKVHPTSAFQPFQKSDDSGIDTWAAVGLFAMRVKGKEGGGRMEFACHLVRGYTKHAGGEVSEKTIRDALGNNPDVSKALRVLVREGEISKYGTGGRLDPFTYRYNI